MNNKPNNGTGNGLNNKPNNGTGNGLNNGTGNGLNSFNNKVNTSLNNKSVKNIYKSMDPDQRKKMIRMIFDKHSFENLREQLTKTKQNKLVKQAKKATLHTLTNSEKKKICVNYKINKNTKKITKKMKQNENNASNRIFNKAMSKK